MAASAIAERNDAVGYLNSPCTLTLTIQFHDSENHR